MSLKIKRISDNYRAIRRIRGNQKNMPESALKKESYHHGDLRSALLDAAEDALQQDPEKDPSLRALAAKLGVSATAPQAHFKNKHELMIALCLRASEHLRNGCLAALARRAPDASPLARAASIGKAYLDFALEKPGYFRLMFSSGIDPSEHEPLRKASENGFEVLRSVVRECLPDGDGQAITEKSLAAWGMIHGFALIKLGGHAHPDFQEISDNRKLAEVATRHLHPNLLDKYPGWEKDFD